MPFTTYIYIFYSQPKTKPSINSNPHPSIQQRPTMHPSKTHPQTLAIFPQSSHSNTPAINANILAFVHLKCSNNKKRKTEERSQPRKMARNLYKLMPMATAFSHHLMQKMIFTPLTYEISLYKCPVPSLLLPLSESLSSVQLPLTYINTLSHKSQFSDA